MHKLFAPLFLALALLPCQGRASGSWEKHPRLGQCFADAKSFVQAEFGPQGLEDENIVVRPAGNSSPESLWVVDQTPTTNYQWYLLEARSKQACLALFIPNAVQADLRLERKSWIVQAKTQASPGFPEKSVAFEKRPGEEIFKAARCVETLRGPRGKSSSRAVPCQEIFEWSFPIPEGEAR